VTWFRRTPLATARWVVVDCETSGLNPQQDRLLSVAAVEITAEHIAAGRSYAAVLQQQEPSRADNILVHGLGGEAQLGGRPAREVLRELTVFMDEAIPVAFHAPFDKAVLASAFAQAGMRAARRPWLDLAELAPVLFPDRRAENLDAWLAAFAIECASRHEALSDAYATAQLLLVVLGKARSEGVATAEALIRLASSAAWLPMRR
jgi:DNA polymerase III subunit epsilon